MERSESKYFITAEKMNEALIDLLSEKSFEYITVKEICAKAGVNRSTFYLHYETVADLLGESMEYLDRQFMSYFNEESKDFVAKIPQMQPEELKFVNAHFLIPYLNYIRDNRRVFQATLAHPEAFQADMRYAKMYKYIIEPIMVKFQIPKEEQSFYNAFYLNGIIAVIKEWLRKDCKDDPEKISELIEKLVMRE